ncbi:PAS domain-containing protein [Sinorhizobium terangae]|uniref:PAS domain-containing protein n=1 Tax=Sinorhizobium terangae TaxID=110322 RepID=UPI0024B15C7E|nr:PAS domain-containing protein [Sinorhizobium terangae]WFU51190.1 PAS domain-containing protein [Sinorhizobium terangae]
MAQRARRRVEAASLVASWPLEALVTEKERSTSSGRCAAAAGKVDPIQAAKVVEELFGNGWAFDATGRWSYLPLFAQTTLGKTPDELNASVAEGDISWKQLLHPDEYEAVAEKWRHCLRTGEMFNAEFRIRRKSGFAWARSAARAVFDERGQITGWYGTSIDIDVHRRTAAALQERENSLSHLVDLVPCHLWRLNADGEPTFMNKRMVDYVGWDITAADEPDKPRLDAIFDTIHPDDADGVRPHLAKVWPRDRALGDVIACGAQTWSFAGSQFTPSR